jgi:peptidoglycan biosynthesis protein MviN/MurJ (putative lipid II flippase)
VTAAIISVAVNVLVSVATVGTLGLSGLALGIAAGAWVEAGILVVLLWQRTPGIHLESLVRAMVEFLIGSVLSALAAVGVVRLTEGLVGTDPVKVLVIAQSAAAFAAAVAVYVAYSWLLRIPELPQLFSLTRSMLPHRFRGG